MVKGIQRTQALIRHRIDAVVRETKTEAYKQSEKVAATMRYLAPEKDGKLVRSIRVEETDTTTVGDQSHNFVGYSIKAGDETTIVTNERGTKFQNARLQEFGTQARPASPYFYPTWRALRRGVRAAMTRAARKAWKGQ